MRTPLSPAPPKRKSRRLQSPVTAEASFVLSQTRVKVIAAGIDPKSNSFHREQDPLLQMKKYPNPGGSPSTHDETRVDLMQFDFFR